MIILRVFNGVELIDLDLYKTDPMKLNLALEDITTTDIKSSFTKSFRVPATSKNNFFFRNVFFVEGRDYDVTIKNPAFILYNGEILKEGHIRLVEIFKNRTLDKIEYEIVFLGEVRDLSSIVGDEAMCELGMEDLIHSFSPQNIILSWQAETNPNESNQNTGLLNGDVVYPLIDYGNTYDKALIGVNNPSGVKETRIATDGVSPNFLEEANPLNPERFRPIIRVKKVLERIMEKAGFTFESEFFNSYPFKNLYVAAHTSDAVVEFEPGKFSDGVFSVEKSFLVNVFDLDFNFSNNSFTIGDYDVVNSNISGNLDTISGVYTAEFTGLYRFTSSITFDISQAAEEPGIPPEEGAIKLVFIKNGTIIIESELFGTNFSFVNSASLNLDFSVTANATDVMNIGIVIEGDVEILNLTNTEWDLISAPGLLDPSIAFDCDYKQIDFIKDLVSMFRLVIAPVPQKSKHFIIEPWKDYIGTGVILDWSSLVNGDKDFRIQPLFDSQSRILEYENKQGNDYINKYHQDAYSYVYGRYRLDSNNELLTGLKKVQINSSSLILSAIDGQPNSSSFYIPKLCIYKGEAEILQKLPIKPEVRFMFYNGLKGTSEGNIGTGIEWYFNDGSIPLTPFTSYPLVSPYSSLTNYNITSSNYPENEAFINWQGDEKYFNSEFTGSTVQLVENKNLYNTYWKRYIDNLYNKFSRKVIVEVILSPEDIRLLEFKDVIFIDGIYYYIEKIVDMPLIDEAYTPVEVHLIKFQHPIDFPFQEYTTTEPPTTEPPTTEPPTTEPTTTDSTTDSTTTEPTTTEPPTTEPPTTEPIICVTGSNQGEDYQFDGFYQIAFGAELSDILSQDIVVNLQMTATTGTQFSETIESSVTITAGSLFAQQQSSYSNQTSQDDTTFSDACIVSVIYNGSETLVLINECGEAIKTCPTTTTTTTAAPTTTTTTTAAPTTTTTTTAAPTTTTTTTAAPTTTTTTTAAPTTTTTTTAAPTTTTTTTAAPTTTTTTTAAPTTTTTTQPIICVTGLNQGEDHQFDGFYQIAFAATLSSVLTQDIFVAVEIEVSEAGIPQTPISQTVTIVAGTLFGEEETQYQNSTGIDDTTFGDACIDEVFYSGPETLVLINECGKAIKTCPN